MFVNVLTLLACLIPILFPIAMFVGSLGELFSAARPQTGLRGIGGIGGADALLSHS